MSPPLSARWLAVLGAGLAACGAPPPPSAAAVAPPPATVEGPVVARVDGEPIGLVEVQATARDTGLTPLAALHRLEQERALLARARRAGLTDDAEVDDATRRAAVQGLLRAQVEETVTDTSIPAEEIAARYAQSRASWARPERRASVHVLATPRDASDAAAQAAASRFVRAAIARLASAVDPAAEADAIEAEGDAGRSFAVRVEHLPSVDRHGALDPAYLSALFALATAPGVAPEPVTTEHGLHAIVLTAIEPPFEVPLSEATPMLRRQLVAEHRAAALDALTERLASATTVAIDERALADVSRADLSAVEGHAP